MAAPSGRGMTRTWKPALPNPGPLYAPLADVDSVAVFLQMPPAVNKGPVRDRWIKVHALLPGTGNKWDRLGPELFSIPFLQDFDLLTWLNGRVPKYAPAVPSPLDREGTEEMQGAFTTRFRWCAPTRVWDGYESRKGSASLGQQLGYINNTDPCCFRDCGDDQIYDPNDNAMYNIDHDGCCNEIPMFLGQACWCSFGLLPCITNYNVEFQPLQQGLGPGAGTFHFRYLCCSAEAAWELRFPPDADVTVKALMISHLVRLAIKGVGQSPLCCVRKEQRAKGMC